MACSCATTNVSRYHVDTTVPRRKGDGSIFLIENGVSARSGASFEQLLANASVELIPTPRKIRSGSTPDERYLGAELGFLRDWNPMENLVYPDP